MKTLVRLVLLALAAIAPILAATGRAETRHVWEKVEITLHSERQYENPYTDVEVWVDLKGPGFSNRCYGFWDATPPTAFAFWRRPLAAGPGGAVRAVPMPASRVSRVISRR